MAAGRIHTLDGEICRAILKEAAFFMDILRKFDDDAPIILHRKVAKMLYASSRVITIIKLAMQIMPATTSGIKRLTSSSPTEPAP